MATDRVHSDIVIQASPGEIYDIIGDLEAYPEWQEEFKEAEILETDEDGWATRARFKLAAMGMSLHMVLAYTYTDTVMSWTLVESDLLQRNEGSYTLTDNGDGTTTLTYELEISSTIPLPSMLRRQLANRIVTGSLKHVKQRAESGV